MKPELRPVSIDTGSPDEQGLLVFMDGRLVAVLVQLSDQHGGEAGCWFLEHGFGCMGGPARPTFADLDSAERWIAGRFAAEGDGRTVSGLHPCPPT